MSRRWLAGFTALAGALLIAPPAGATVINPAVTNGQPTAWSSALNSNGLLGIDSVVDPSALALQNNGSPILSTGTCADPGLSSDLTLPSWALCFHGGPVLHANEVYALTWDTPRRYFSDTRQYVQTFLQNVANASGTTGNEYALTAQYTDGTARAAYQSLFGGSCVDYGSQGGSSCRLGGVTGNGIGHDYGANGCTPTGRNAFWEAHDGSFPGIGGYTQPNDRCLTDVQIQGEVAAMAAQVGFLGHTRTGFTPVVALLLPPGVVACTDASGAICSANAAGSAAAFCSYHGVANVGGRPVPYVVQPWVADTTACDDPSVPALPIPPTPQQLANWAAQQLVNPLSRSHIAAIVNPYLNGWFAQNGTEIDDNGCTPLPQVDGIQIGGVTYYLQREFNNAGTIETEPNALVCQPNVILAPTFVAPSEVDLGDVVELDGSATDSSLIIPSAAFAWDFGDGTTATGPSVVHQFAKAGNYTIKLKTTDRGGNTATFTQAVTVVDPHAPVQAPPTPGQGTGATGSSGPPALHATVSLVPQSFASVLRHGLVLNVTANQAADGIASIYIPRSLAKQAKLRAGKDPAVLVGLGTISGLKDGSATLRLSLPAAVARKLARFRHAQLTIRLALRGAGGLSTAVALAGNY